MTRRGILTKMGMSKIKYIALAAIFLFLCLIFFGNHLFCQPLLNHLEKRFEKKWDCEIDIKSADCNLLKGSLSFKDTHLTTPANADPRWTLDVDEIFIQIEYSSVFRANLIINELILDRLIFRHEELESNAPKREHMPPAMISKEIDTKDPGKEKPKRRGALVRCLLIRGGHFEFNLLSGPGKANKVTIENVSLKKGDVFLGREVHAFFRSLLEPLGYFTPIGP